jgi:hypothetical protein
MKIQSKCSICLEWTENSGKIEDRCIHCGELLHKSHFENKNKALTNQLIDKQSSLLVIREEDGTLLRFLKRTGIIVQFIFVSFASFVIWLVTLLTG